MGWFRKKLKIWKSEYLTEPSNKPGKIIQVGRNGVKVATSNGTVLLKEVSMNDQKEKASNLFSIDDEGLILG